MGYKIPHELTADSPSGPHPRHRSRPAPHRLGRGRRRGAREQGPRLGHAEDPAAQARAEIAGRGGCACDRNYPRASPSERPAAAEGGRHMMLREHTTLPPPLRGRVGEGGGPESLCPGGPPPPPPPPRGGGGPAPAGSKR